MNIKKGTLEKKLSRKPMVVGISGGRSQSRKDSDRNTKTGDRNPGSNG